MAPSMHGEHQKYTAALQRPPTIVMHSKIARIACMKMSNCLYL